jgi:MFS family permease
MLGGRIIFGCASENLLISQTAIIGKWFRGKELSTAIGYIMTMPEVASAANSFITPMMYDKFNGLAYPLYFSVFLCFLSFLCGIVLCILDRKNEIK